MPYKPCKDCGKTGKFEPSLGKVLCEEHRDVQRNFRNLWEAISEIQLLRGR